MRYKNLLKRYENIQESSITLTSESRLINFESKFQLWMILHGTFVSFFFCTKGCMKVKKLLNKRMSHVFALTREHFFKAYLNI